MNNQNIAGATIASLSLTYFKNLLQEISPTFYQYQNNCLQEARFVVPQHYITVLPIRKNH
ncbi:MAG TPA: hypothetical protein VMT76_06155 [Puia sp.]|nr:hypothetical protein [Puia sp.]